MKQGSFVRGFLSAMLSGAMVVPMFVLGGGGLEAQVSSGGGQPELCGAF